jgi:hypothetical protein
MTEPADPDTELSAADLALTDKLEGARAVPAAGFRGALGRRLLADDPGYGTRPQRLRLTVSGFVGAGVMLLALGALQATGSL